MAARKLEVLAGAFEGFNKRLELDRVTALSVDETVRDPEAGLEKADPAITAGDDSDPEVAPLLVPDAMFELDVILEETLVLEPSGILVDGTFVSDEPEGIL